jgi:metal-responsive CopG/Arc/MetJ family transcriptional regulator
MSKSRIKGTKKTRGRPATGIGTQIGMRWPEQTLTAIDEWRERQTDAPTRSQAIRQLVEFALNVTSHKGGLPLNAAAASMPKDLGKRIERWAKAMGQDSHSEAMRHLLELGLKAPKKRKGVK